MFVASKSNAFGKKPFKVETNPFKNSERSQRSYLTRLDTRVRNVHYYQAYSQHYYYRLLSYSIRISSAVINSVRCIESSKTKTNKWKYNITNIRWYYANEQCNFNQNYRLLIQMQSKSMRTCVSVGCCCFFWYFSIYSFFRCFCFIQNLKKNICRFRYKTITNACVECFSFAINYQMSFFLFCLLFLFNELIIAMKENKLYVDFWYACA